MQKDEIFEMLDNISNPNWSLHRIHFRIFYYPKNVLDINSKFISKLYKKKMDGTFDEKKANESFYIWV